MKALYDRPRALSEGLAAIRAQFQLPAAFPAPVLEAAAAAAAVRQPLTGYADRTAAFGIEASGSDLILRYAIADVGAFVGEGDPIDTEAWARGETIYLPDGKISLYPPAIGEGAASLLTDGDRPAILCTVRVRPDGGVALEGV